MEVQDNKENRWWKLIKLKARFAVTSGLATLLYNGLYLLFVYNWLESVPAHVLSYSIAIVVNFMLQKRYIFDLQRRVSTAFLMAMAVSAGGLGLSTLLIWWLGHYDFFNTYEPLKSLTVSGILFFYNFYGKRFSFERRLLD